jgi:FdhE protein
VKDDGNPLGAIPADVPYVRLPGNAAGLFSRRAERLRELALGHAAGDWLEALAQLCQAQAQAVALVAPALPPRDVTAREPLHFVKLARQAAWRDLLDVIAGVMRKAELPAPARAAVARLATAGTAAREAWAEALLAGAEHDLEAAGAPIVAAALQAWWTALAAQLGVAATATSGSDADCPVCAAPPVAGVVLGDDKVRYLSCSLCASEWHRARVQCVVCGSAAQVSYQAIAGGAAGIKAETCAGCKAYIKLFYREEVPRAEALADDAATLALDILLGEAGYARCGVNLLVAP